MKSFFRNTFFLALVTYCSGFITDAREANGDLINKLNVKDSAKYSFNKYSDISHHAFKRLYHGYRSDMNQVCEMYDNIYRYDTIPDNFDWRDWSFPVVTNVKDQGQCGSCWSFSASGDIEGSWALAGNKIVNISEQQFVDCDSLDGGCNGGLMTNAFQYAIKNGLELSNDYEYVAIDERCRFNMTDAVVKISNYTCLGTDEVQIAQYLVQHGPLSIALNADPMQFYDSGISNPPDCDPSQLDHGVLLVGYGVENGVKYWTIKNSWGADWGENGYYRLIRGVGACGMNTAVSHSIV